MLPKKLAFVDVETTGLYPSRDRVIEIGIIRVENDKVVERFSQLINPKRPLPNFIQTHTNISNEMVREAPTFAQLQPRISELLADTVFIAHNAGFDHGFLKYEFARLEQPFNPQTLCTVQLSRRLYPMLRSHSLDNIIRTFRFPCENRHRALDDAAVLWQFYQQIVERFPAERIMAQLS